MLKRMYEQGQQALKKGNEKSFQLLNNVLKFSLFMIYSAIFFNLHITRDINQGYLSEQISRKADAAKSTKFIF